MFRRDWMLFNFPPNKLGSMHEWSDSAGVFLIFCYSRSFRLRVGEPNTGNKSLSRLVIGTSRTVGSAKKFVRITSGFGGGEFTKTLRKVCTCQKLKFSFLLLEYCKIRECYAVANAFTISNMYSLFLYMKCNSRKINRPMKNMTKIVTLLHF